MSKQAEEKDKEQVEEATFEIAPKYFIKQTKENENGKT
jgi:hypothetical protein